MDLTPRKWRKKVDTRAGKRRISFRIAKHWRNPFQIAIVAVALASFVGSTAVDRIRQHQVFEEAFAHAKELRIEMDSLNTQAMMIHTNLQVQFGDAVDKNRSKEEQELVDQLAGLSRELDRCFAEINTCFSTIVFRYRSMETVQNWFVDTARWSFETALARSNPEQARLWFNSCPVNALLLDMKPVIMGAGSLEIDAGDDVYEIIMWALKSDESRLVAANHVGRSSTFPFTISPLEKGSYLMMVTRADGGFAPYPVHISHGENRQMKLEVPPSIPKGMYFVPGGPFLCGGESSLRYRKHTRNLPSFFIKKHEVTFAEYIGFWESLSDADQQSRMMSRVRFSENDPNGLEAWDAEGRLTDERLKPEYPVVGITPEAAVAFCEWKSRQTGSTVRLPTAFEWEKSARGVDGRSYPWGYGFEPDANLALTQDNPKAKEKYPLWAPVGKFKNDISVYNVLDMGGSVRELVSLEEGGFEIRGGSMATPAAFMKCTHVSTTNAIPNDVGFRYVMER